MQRAWPALFVVWLVACDRAEPEPEIALGPSSDRCSTLPEGCRVGDRLGDGCPDTVPLEVVFAPGASVLDEPGERLLEGVSADGRELAPGVILHLVATGPEDELARARLETVRAGLQARGVPTGRLTTYGAALAEPGGSAVRIVAEGCRSPAR